MKHSYHLSCAACTAKRSSSVLYHRAAAARTGTCAVRHYTYAAGARERARATRESESRERSARATRASSPSGACRRARSTRAQERRSRCTGAARAGAGAGSAELVVELAAAAYMSTMTSAVYDFPMSDSYKYLIRTVSPDTCSSIVSRSGIP